MSARSKEVGLFVLPEKPSEDYSPEELIDAAIANLELWKSNPLCDYLASGFALPMIKEAVRKRYRIELHGEFTDEEL